MLFRSQAAERWPAAIHNDAEVIEHLTAPVRVTTLDAYADARLDGRRVGFVKIDVQGAEALAIAGARRLLARDRPVLLMEFWPQGIRGMGGDPWAMIDGLLGLGYALQVIEREAPGHLRALPDRAALARIDLAHPQAYANLVLVPPG